MPSPPRDNRPLIIAHRGASGERPEHTLASYELAIEQGCDFIEPDLVLTRDGVLVARHENEMSETTDVADHPEFATRYRAKIIEGEKREGWFSEDFTLAEIKTLRARERLPHLRSTAHDGRYTIPTFAEILQLVAEANKRGHSIGVYPETKHPVHFAEIGLPHEQPLLQLLDRYGYRGRGALLYIQSFAVGNLQALRAKSDLPLIQLISAQGHPADRPKTPYSAMVTPSGLRAIADYADGIGPDKRLIIPRTPQGELGQPTALVANAHAVGLKVHPWTFRRENHFLPRALRSAGGVAEHGDLAQEIAAYIATGIDGLFTDNTAEAVAMHTG